MMTEVTPARKPVPTLTMWFLAVALLIWARSVTALPTKNVLVLYSFSRLVPGNVDVDRGLSAVLTLQPPSRMKSTSPWVRFRRTPILRM